MGKFSAKCCHILLGLNLALNQNDFILAYKNIWNILDEDY